MDETMPDSANGETQNNSILSRAMVSTLKRPITTSIVLCKHAGIATAMEFAHHPETTFEEVFQAFEANTTPRIHHIIKNIQYFYETSDKASEKQVNENFLNEWNFASRESGERDGVSEDDESGEVDEAGQDPDVTEEDVEAALMGSFSTREVLYADVALNIACDFKFFSCDTQSSKYQLLESNATEADLHRPKEWTSIVDQTSCKEIDESIVNEGRIVSHNNSQETPTNNEGLSELVTIKETTNVMHNEMVTGLNEDQLIAYTIIHNHLHQHLQGVNPKPLHMLIVSQGGTGKSALLNAVTSLFEAEDVSSLLAKTATSGVAASLIKGSTIHWWAGIPIKTPKSNQWATHPRPDMADCRRANILGKLLLTVNEMSLLMTDNLLLILQVTSIIKSINPSIDSTIPFGGLSIVMIGDFHQFPPVGKANRVLFSRRAPLQHSKVGRNLYLQFETVVKLNKQMQIKDVVWTNVLN